VQLPRALAAVGDRPLHHLAYTLQLSPTADYARAPGAIVDLYSYYYSRCCRCSVLLRFLHLFDSSQADPSIARFLHASEETAAAPAPRFITPHDKARSRRSNPNQARRLITPNNYPYF
jgi:hypothetical protein